MSESISFAMGNFEAILPIDRLYARNHMWFQLEATPSTLSLPATVAATDSIYRVGLGAYAVRLLQDVYFLSWDVEPGDRILAKQQMGEIESSKAISNIYAPANGILVDLNQSLLSDPSLINSDAYARGWLFHFVPQTAELLTAEQYRQHLEATWEQTQAHLKGQMHDD